MTLKQLVDEINKLLSSGADPDVIVISEGCDCDGIIGSVEYTDGRHSYPPVRSRVYLKREDFEF